MNNDNENGQLQTNNNYQHHQHSITIDQPTPHSLNRTNTYASDEQTLAEPRPRRTWESDRQTSECRKCNRKFNFLVRRHHCRRCGQIFCDRCSSHRIKLPVEEIVEDPMISTSHYPIIALSPQRVCDACIRIPIKADSTSSRYNFSSPSSSSPYGKMVNQLRPAPVNMKRSDSQQSLMAECPVCGTGLLGMRKSQQENHLNQCLNTGSPTVRPPRYIVYTIAEGAAQLGDECPICFEEFQVGHKIARMVCLCSYHKHCLRDWLERGKGCPIHYDSYIQTT
ncbi:hypothetical protein BJ944DRAFT_162312 [Cunninghamella echinulata]|nr:hypothetical protein BJ944DRAFT_162312 [Cunninghamella echinulata]